MSQAINQTFPFLVLPYDKSFSGSGDNNDSVVAWGNKVALTAKDSDEVVIFDRTTQQEIASFPVNNPNSIRYYDGQLFVTTKGGSRKIKVYDADTYAFAFEFAGTPELQDGEHDLAIWYRPDGVRVALCTDDSNNIYGYDVDTDTLLYTIPSGVKKGIEEIQVIHRPNASFDWMVLADENQDPGFAFRSFKLFPDGTITPHDWHGPGLMVEDSEGLSHDPAPDGITGYLFSTDQQEPDTVFHCWYYDDNGFTKLGEFKINGVGNTDGTYINDGEFFAVNDDMDVKSIQLADFYATAGLGFGVVVDPDPDPTPTDCTQPIADALAAQKAQIKADVEAALATHKSMLDTARATMISEINDAISVYESAIITADTDLNSELSVIFG